MFIDYFKDDKLAMSFSGASNASVSVYLFDRNGIIIIG